MNEDQIKFQTTFSKKQSSLDQIKFECEYQNSDTDHCGLWYTIVTGTGEARTDPEHKITLKL